MMKILIAEDEIYARKSMKKQILELDLGREFHILEAQNGEQGLELFRQEEPDLVFTDIRMPKMDGLELLKEIKKEDPEAKVIMVSAYADFAYAKSAIKFGAEGYLLKPIEDGELKEFIMKFRQQNTRKKEQAMFSGKDMVTRFIAQSVQEEEAGKDLLAERMFGKVFWKYQVLVLWFAGRRYPDREEFMLWLHNIYGQEVWTAFRLIELEKDIWMLVMEADGQSRFRQKHIIQKLLEEEYDCYLGISAECKTPGELKRALAQATVAVENKIYSDEHLLEYRVVAGIKAVKYEMSEEQKNYLQISLERKSRDKIQSALCEIFRHMEEKGRIHVDSLEIFLAQAAVLIHQAAGRPIPRLRLIDFSHMEEMKQRLLETAEEYCTCGSNGQTLKGEDIIRGMKEYARKNYHLDISIRMLAEKVFYMNAAYLSHLFTEKTGISYSAYIRRLRVEKAREFLEKDTYSITDIASMVGYNDTSQFIRIFKQEMGMTPKKYRCKKTDGN